MWGIIWAFRLRDMWCIKERLILEENKMRGLFSGKKTGSQCDQDCMQRRNTHIGKYKRIQHWDLVRTSDWIMSVHLALERECLLSISNISGASLVSTEVSPASRAADPVSLTGSRALLCHDHVSSYSLYGTCPVCSALWRYKLTTALYWSKVVKETILWLWVSNLILIEQTMKGNEHLHMYIDNFTF